MLCYGYIEMPISCENEVLVWVSSGVPSSCVLPERAQVKIPSPSRHPVCPVLLYAGWITRKSTGQRVWKSRSLVLKPPLKILKMNMNIETTLPHETKTSDTKETALQ